MPIYRHDQARLSIGSESGLAAYAELIDTTTDAGGVSTSLTGDHAAGSRSLTVASNADFAVGNYVLIEVAGLDHTEIRRVVGLSGTTILLLDYPTGFYHLGGVNIDRRTNAAPTGTTYTSTTTAGGINFATFLPGVYETITTPDLTPELLPQYFLKTTGDRNWGYMYRGRQTFSGSLPNLILLNGYPLKYPFGRVATTGTDVGGGGGSTISSATFVGRRNIPVTDRLNYANGDFIQIDTGNNSEVRQIISGAGAGAGTFVLNYPLLIAHASGVVLNEVTSPYTHTIIEDADLPSMSWHLSMRDTGETAANDFIRRFVGGVCNRATLSANEGELLRFSLDEVQFIDLVHNQTRHSGVTGDSSTADIMAKSSNMLLAPLGIGGDMPHSAGLLAAPSYPTTEPYYFSQGNISIFGITFARIRNFRLDINNNTEPRYYIRDLGTERTPIDIQEQRREYTLTATIAMEDSVAASATTRTLWKELILEGAYTGTGTSALQGFDMTLTFTRGTNDDIVITSPPLAATTAFERQGCFFRRAQNSIETESPVQVEGEIIMRSLSVVIRDALGVYP